MKAVIYARFSSSSQREESIDGQIRVCKDYAQNNNITIIDNYCDRAISGKTDNRPAFKRLLADSKKHLFDIVLVYSIDRFGRNLIQALTNQVKLEDNGVKIVSATENFTNDASGRFFQNMMMSYAQFYSDELRQKIQRGMDENGSKFLATGGTALGYYVDEDKHYQINPHTAPTVKRIYEMYASGKTITEISNQLNAEGHTTSQGTPFNKNSFHTILKNKRYIGIYTYKGVETPNAIPRIISDELFYKVQEIMEKNRKAPARARAKVEYILTTKIFCGHCKEMMTGFSGTGKQGKKYRYYVCNGTKKKQCDKKMVSKEYIEDLVIKICRKMLTADNINKIAKEVVKISESEKDNTNLGYLQKQLNDNKKREKNTIDAITECDIDTIRKTLYEKLNELQKQQEKLKHQISIEETPYPVLSVSEIKFFLTSLKKGNADDIKYRRALIRLFVNEIFLYDDRFTITFNTDNDPITITDKLLSDIESKGNEQRVLFKDGSGPLKKCRIYGTFFNVCSISCCIFSKCWLVNFIKRVAYPGRSLVQLDSSEQKVRIRRVRSDGNI